MSKIVKIFGFEVTCSGAVMPETVIRSGKTPDEALKSVQDDFPDCTVEQICRVLNIDLDKFNELSNS